MTLIERIELQAAARELRQTAERVTKTAPSVAMRVHALARECETKVADLERRTGVAVTLRDGPSVPTVARHANTCVCPECSP